MYYHDLGETNRGYPGVNRFRGYAKERHEAMRLLRLAVERQRWDLAAHTIILGTASVLRQGGSDNASKGKRKERGAKRQSER